MRNPSARHRALVSLLFAAAVLAGCSGSPSGEAKPSAAEGSLQVVAAFYPLQFLAEEVGGPGVSVTSLAAPGVEPHDLELSPQQVASISSADLVLRIPGFMPAVDDAVAQQAADRSVDITAGLSLLEDHEHGGEHITDPHVWLSPSNMKAMATTLARAMAKADPQRAAEFTRNAESVGQSMAKLGAEMAAGAKACRIKPMVVSHEAFGYLARDLGLTQVGISGLSPEAEPSPARLKEITDTVKSQGITTIYSETLLSPKVAETIAAETGAKTAVLDPIEGNTDDKGYEALMRQNLSVLRTGQECS